jgi:hypothetical protein
LLITVVGIVVGSVGYFRLFNVWRTGFYMLLLLAAVLVATGGWVLERLLRELRWEGGSKPKRVKSSEPKLDRAKHLRMLYALDLFCGIFFGSGVKSLFDGEEVRGFALIATGLVVFAVRLILRMVLKGVDDVGDDRYGSRELEHWLKGCTKSVQLLEHLHFGNHYLRLVAVSETGIYCISTNSYRGRLSFRDGQAAVEGSREISVSTFLASAKELESLLNKEKYDYKVKPLLVFTDAATEIVELSDYTVVPLRWLNRYVCAEIGTISPLQCSLIANRIKHIANATDKPNKSNWMRM